MLRITAIEKIAPFKYLVTMDRDGLERTYVFSTLAPYQGAVSISPPVAFMLDIEDYWPDDPHHRPFTPGPPVWEIPRTLVRKLALGEDISLPVILDER